MTDCATKIYQNAGNLPLLERLPVLLGGRVLDCGCGAGDNARILKGRGWTVTGITVNPEERRIASQYCKEVYLADLNDGIPKTAGDGFDIILFSHVLEHLSSPGKLLHESRKLLALNGRVAVALPNVLFYPYRFKFLRGKFEYDAAGGTMDETHLRFYTFTTGMRLLESSGYKLERAEADGVFPLWKLRNIIPASLVRSLNDFATARWPDLFGYQSLYVASIVR